MTRKTPTEVIATAAAQLPATLVFNSEAAAVEWASMHLTAMLRHRFQQMQLTREDRDAVDPIEAGYVHAKDMGTRPRRQRIPWMDALVGEVAEACFCELVPLRGTLSSWLIGRRSDRAAAMQLIASLVPTAERLGQDAYLREYHAHRKAGDVEAARGFKDQWHLEQVAQLHAGFAQQIATIEQEYPEAAEAFHQARLDITEYMNENFLPTRGNKNERKRQ